MYECKAGSSTTWTCMATMGGYPKRIPFKIFDTDYETYDLSYFCEEKLGFKSENIAVALRHPA